MIRASALAFLAATICTSAGERQIPGNLEIASCVLNSMPGGSLDAASAEKSIYGGIVGKKRVWVVLNRPGSHFQKASVTLLQDGGQPVLKVAETEDATVEANLNERIALDTESVDRCFGRRRAPTIMAAMGL